MHHLCMDIGTLYETHREIRKDGLSLVASLPYSPLQIFHSSEGEPGKEATLLCIKHGDMHSMNAFFSSVLFALLCNSYQLANSWSLPHAVMLLRLC